MPLVAAEQAPLLESEGLDLQEEILRPALQRLVGQSERLVPEEVLRPH